jgi:hypothetical protein
MLRFESVIQKCPGGRRTVFDDVRRPPIQSASSLQPTTRVARVLVALDVTAFAGAVLRAGTRDPPLTFAGVLALATVLGALASALAFAAIAANTLYVGLIFRAAAVLSKDRLRSKH